VGIGTSAKRALNSALAGLNLRLDTLTRERAERRRLAQLVAHGHFERPAYPLSPAMREMSCAATLALLERYRDQFPKFNEPGRNAAGFSYDNEYYPSPDAEVLYAMVRHFRPATIVEIGSGNSTRLIRQAIQDEQGSSRLVCIDPAPRIEVGNLADRLHRRAVEELEPTELAGMLEPGSLLFVDSSHQISPAGDLAFIYFRLLPALPPGVLVHIHDIFLPYEYPRAWVVDNGWGWNEQSLVQAMLAYGSGFEVLWAGHYLQRTLADFAAHFPHTLPRVASSLWLRTAARS
jgi:hypothetical protein